MAHIEYNTKGVCSRRIEIEVENDIIQNVIFHGGCAGNTQGVAALIKGMTVDEAIARLKGTIFIAVQCLNKRKYPLLHD